MNIDSAFPSNYLKASDLGDAQPIVTIDRVEVEAIGRNKEVKPVLYFRGKEKGLVLNKTNANKIAGILGSKDTDEWVGKRVVIYATETEFGGETVECIRIKAAAAAAQPKAKPQPQPVTEELDEESIPF